MKYIILFFLVNLCANDFFSEKEVVMKTRYLDLDALANQKIILSTKRILLPEYPHAQNPSILKTDQGFLLSFRITQYPWISQIGVVLLDEQFEPIIEPQILDTRSDNKEIASHSEDATLFTYNNRIYLLYNDIIEVNRPWYGDRRDMFLAELIEEEGVFTLKSPLKLIYEQKYFNQLWQKNWAGFVWNNQLLLKYSTYPHEILFPSLADGACYSCYETTPQIDWQFGHLRGSGAALMVDGEYLAFFHSGIQVTSAVTSERDHLWHYFAGAYTFSPNPPFEITRISPHPIVGEGFYASSGLEKRIIFPGGFVIDEPYIYLAYGKDDCELWIATIDKKELMKSLIPVKK